MKILGVQIRDQLQQVVQKLYQTHVITAEPVMMQNCSDAEVFLQGHLPDIVLADGECGLMAERLTFIKRISRRVPVVVVNGELTGDMQRYLQAGAQEVLPASLVREDTLLHALRISLMRYQREKRLHTMLEQSQKMEAIGRMAGGIAHDYNNMLTVILNNAVLARESIAEESMAYADLQDQISAIKQASVLTRRLLMMSRRKPESPELLDVARQVSGMRKIFRHVTGDRIELKLICGESPVYVRADAAQLEQALLNLVINACDAMWYEGVLTIETGCSDLLGHADNLYFDLPDHPERTFAMICVRDCGDGISTEVLPHIFEPFYTTKGERKGTGLGLYQVYSTIRQHNGFIAVESSVGGGTEFCLFFPAASAAECTNVEGGETAAVPPVMPMGSETVLLVEDDPLVRVTTRRIMERLGYVVYEADCATKALALGTERLQSVSLLLCDVMMPDMDGIRLADKLRQDVPDLKILMASGYPEERLAQRGLVTNGYRFIAKPFFKEQLATVLRELLDG